MCNFSSRGAERHTHRKLTPVIYLRSLTQNTEGKSVDELARLKPAPLASGLRVDGATSRLGGTYIEKPSERFFHRSLVQRCLVPRYWSFPWVVTVVVGSLLEFSCASELRLQLTRSFLVALPLRTEQAGSQHSQADSSAAYLGAPSGARAS